MLDIREATPADSWGMKHLMELTIQEGVIKTQNNVLVEDAFSALNVDRPGIITFLAYHPQAGDTPVGTISGWPHQVRLANFDHEIQAVLAYRLSVHPEYRRKGIGKALWHSLSEWIKSNYGDQVLIYGHYQKGNEASIASFKSADAVFTQRQVNLAPIKTLPPGSIKDSSLSESLTFRRIGDQDLAKTVEQLNRFYQGYDLFSPETVQSLKEFTEPVEIDQQMLEIREYYVLEDNASGKLLAGTGIINLPSLFDIKVVEMPLAVKMLNLAFKIVPQSGSLASSMACKMWYDPARVDAAKYLWQRVREVGNAGGNSIVVHFDKQGNLEPMLGLSRLQPMTHIFLALLSVPDELNIESLTASRNVRPLFYL